MLHSSLRLQSWKGFAQKQSHLFRDNYSYYTLVLAKKLLFIMPKQMQLFFQFLKCPNIFVKNSISILKNLSIYAIDMSSQTGQLAESETT